MITKKETVLEHIKEGKIDFWRWSKDLCSDKEVILAAVQKAGTALVCASNDLKNDKGIVLAAVKNDGCALRYASASLRIDKDVVLTAIQQDPESYRLINRDFVIKCIMACCQPDNEIINRRDYIATKLWSREDVKTELIERGYAGTEDEVDAVINTGCLRSLGNCTDGDWAIIDTAIWEATKTGNITKTLIIA